MALTPVVQSRLDSRYHIKKLLWAVKYLDQSLANWKMTAVFMADFLWTRVFSRGIGGNSSISENVFPPCM